MKQELIHYIKELAFFEGDFVLSSGQKSSFYIDLRKISLDFRVAPIIGKVMLELIQDIPDVAAVGGMTMGADPVACAIMHQAIVAGKAYNAFVVRKQQKSHGLTKLIEGPDINGRRVVILEDTSTTGNSPIAAAHAAREAGAEVAAVAVVLDRNTGAREAVENSGYQYLAALSLEDVLGATF